MTAAPAWTYEEALAWLYARQSLGIQLGLDKVEELLRRLGDPHLAYKVAHVGGTNGKGSVTRMLADTLRRSGLKVGCTTSPHLVTFTERIEVDGMQIGKEEAADGLSRVRPHVEALDAQDKRCTFFEIVTALAFLTFREAGVDWAVVEVGMGGRLDATNVVQPSVCLITNIAPDHTQFLGATVAEIAYEKSGIMKPGVPCVTAAQGDALTVLAARSHELRVPMSLVASALAVTPSTQRRADYIVADLPPGAHFAIVRPNGESFFQAGLAGAHQRENAALVVAAVDALRRQGATIPERAVADAIREARNPGRLDLYRIPSDEIAPGSDGRTIEVLVDGAHNPAAGEALRSHLFDIHWSGYHLIAGFCADKEWLATVGDWLMPAAHLWAVPVRNPRSLDPPQLRDAGTAAGVRADVAADFEDALRLAVEAGANQVVVAGSLFLAGEAIAWLNGESLEEIRGSQ